MANLDLNRSFSSVVEQVSPAIVSIYTKVTIEANPAEIFGPFMFHEPKKIEREALGSGVIVTRRGLIVTNDHVIEKADKIKVITADEQQYDAEVVMRDGLHDIAIIRIISEDDEDEDMEDEDYDEQDYDEDEELNDDNMRDENENEIENDDNIDENEEAEGLMDGSNRNRKNREERSGQSGGKQRKKRKNTRRKRGGRGDMISLNEEIDKEPESEHGRSFPYLTMGTAELCKVGDYVLAIGNNLGFHGTVTDGIISAIGRTNDERLPIAYPQFPLIQTNASINPGSSGGALVNMKGELIGINESIATSTGGNVGVGFAVPVNFLRPLLRSAMKKSFVYEIERVWDGISPVPCPIAILPKDSVVEAVGAEGDKLRVSSHQKRGYPRGIRVKSIHKQSPAAIAGIKRNDIILRINDVDIDNINTYYLLIAGADPNIGMKYDIIREKRSMFRRNKQSSSSNSGNLRGRGRSRSAGRSRSNSAGSSSSSSPSGGTSQQSNKQLNNRSWVDFGDNIEKHLISVTIELIPLPEKKPLEIKDRLNPFYGAQIVELCPAINSDFGLDFAQQGVAIWDVEPGSQANKLGFKIGDIILSIDNQRLRTLEDIENIGDRLQTRKSCRIKFKRSGKINHVDVYLRTRRRYFSRL